MSVEIQLTKKQAELIEWALDPMRDYWTTPEGADERLDPEYGDKGIMYSEDQLPKLNGLTLVLSPIDEINKDLRYRTTVQMHDMIEQSGESNRQIAASLRVLYELKDKLANAGVELDEVEDLED